MFPPRHVSPLPGRSWVPQGVRLPITQVTSFFFSHPRLKFPLFKKKQSGHLDLFKGALIALMALRSQLLWPAMVLVNNCYAQQPKLILFHWSCVFLIVRAAIAGCRCFSSSLTERRATLYLTGESRLRSPSRPLPSRHFLSDGSLYFKAVLFLTYGLMSRGQSAHFQIRF